MPRHWSGAEPESTVAQMKELHDHRNSGLGAAWWRFDATSVVGPEFAHGAGTGWKSVASILDTSSRRLMRTNTSPAVVTTFTYFSVATTSAT